MGINKTLPVTSAKCPRRVHNTDGGVGIKRHTDNVASSELQASLYLSSWANFIAVTVNNDKNIF